MDRYIFYGHVRPERCNISLNSKTLNTDQKEIQITFNCIFSRLIIDCACTDNTINIHTLKNYIEQAARNIIDAFGYTIASGFDIEIDSVYMVNSSALTIFGVHENIFDDEALNTQTALLQPHPEIPCSHEKIADIALKDIFLQIALADFREAIRKPNFTAFHCYRAIEALRQSFLANKDKESWKKFRETLSVEECTLMQVKEMADPLRHGNPISQTWSDRKFCMLTTWETIKKYIAYKKSL